MEKVSTEYVFEIFRIEVWIKLLLGPTCIPTNKPSTSDFTAESLLKAISLILNSLYFKFGPNTLNQTQGLPMGLSWSSFAANLFLFYYEFKWLKRCLLHGKYNLVHQNAVISSQ